MLYNLLVINAESGINLATIKLSDAGFEQDEGVLMSGILRAIQQFLQELEIGQIQNFETQEKQIIVLKQGSILVALIFDINDESELYLPKIKYIVNLFENHCDWSCWDGDTTSFSEIIEQSEKLLKISDEEFLLYFSNNLMKVANEINQILGFRIYRKGKVEKQVIKEIDDFELSTFFNSDMIDSFIEIGRLFRGSLTNIIIPETIQRIFIDYQQFSILGYYIGLSFFIIIFLPGKLNPLTDVERINKKLINMGGFMDFSTYIEGFKQIPGVFAVGIVKELSNPKLYKDSRENKEFEQAMLNISGIVKNKIMGLGIGSFMFKDACCFLLCYYEQDILLVLHLDKGVDFTILKKKVDKFLNDLLVSS